MGSMGDKGFWYMHTGDNVVPSTTVTMTTACSDRETWWFVGNPSETTTTSTFHPEPSAAVGWTRRDIVHVKLGVCAGVLIGLLLGLTIAAISVRGF
jgi:hypothetical protein